MKMPILDAIVSAVMGYVVVFIGLVLLMAVIALMGKAMTAKKTASAPAAGAAKAPAVPAAPAKTAPGSAGELKLHGVPARDAAMIMAIVADKMGKPLNELRFKSIKEVK